MTSSPNSTTDSVATPGEPGRRVFGLFVSPPIATAIGIASAFVALVIAAGLWSTIGFAAKDIGFIGFLICAAVSGAAVGGLMRIGGAGMKGAAWVAVVVTILGCYIGDQIKISWMQQTPLFELLDTKLNAMIQSSTNPLKLLMYFGAAYLAYSIAQTRRAIAYAPPPTSPQMPVTRAEKPSESVEEPEPRRPGKVGHCANCGLNLRRHKDANSCPECGAYIDRGIYRREE